MTRPSALQSASRETITASSPEILAKAAAVRCYRIAPEWSATESIHSVFTASYDFQSVAELSVFSSIRRLGADRLVILILAL